MKSKMVLGFCLLALVGNIASAQETHLQDMTFSDPNESCINSAYVADEIGSIPLAIHNREHYAMEFVCRAVKGLQRLSGLPWATAHQSHMQSLRAEIRALTVVSSPGSNQTLYADLSNNTQSIRIFPAVWSQLGRRDQMLGALHMYLLASGMSEADVRVEILQISSQGF